jgi:integrase/recombinase XerC
LVSESTEITKITFNHIRSWIVVLSKDGISNRSINRKISSVRSFFKFLKRNKPDIINPCDKIVALKIPKRLPSVIKESEMNSLYQVVFQNKEVDYFLWRDFMLVELIYNTGIRRAELISITFEDIDLFSKTLKVYGKGGKERLIPLNPTILDYLDQYLNFRREVGLENKFLFLSNKLNKLYPKAVYNIVKKYLSLISTIENRGPHALRHSFATHITNRGAELNAVKALLGHSSLAATQVYLHNSIDQLKEVYKQAHPKG